MAYKRLAYKHQIQIGSKLIPLVQAAQDVTLNTRKSVLALPWMLDAGQVQWTVPGTYQWTVPAGVFSISAVSVGAGGGGFSHPSAINGQWGSSGGGGGTGWRTTIAVTPGEVLTIVVGAGGAISVFGSGTAKNGGDSYIARASTKLVAGYGGLGGGDTGSNSSFGLGGGYLGDGGGNGGKGVTFDYAVAGGGGAGGYSGAGGNGADIGNSTAGNGGGGSGGTGGSSYAQTGAGGQGGGVGLFGQGTAGAAVTARLTKGNAGSQYAGSGEVGGGGSAGVTAGLPGQDGGVRIVWGTGRSYPNYCPNV